MKDGVIADFETTEKMLQYFIKKTRTGNQFLKPRIVIGIPSEITQVERRAVRDAALRARANEVFLIEQAMAAAIGADLPITEPGGNMIVDIGGGTTDVAVISLSGIVIAKSVRIASNEMDEAIIQYIKKKYNLLIGERTAEQIKIKIGSAFPLDEPLEMEIKGRDLTYGIPKTLNINDSEIREALEGVVQTLIEVVKNTLEKTPPELAADIVDRGIILCGGGALLKNLDKRLREETSLPIFIADDPLSSVVLGAGKILENLPLLEKIGNAHLTPAAASSALKKRSAVLVLILFVDLILISSQIMLKNRQSLLQTVIANMLMPLQLTFQKSSDFVGGELDRYLFLRGIFKKYQLLKKKQVWTCAWKITPEAGAARPAVAGRSEEEIQPLPAGHRDLRRHQLSLLVPGDRQGTRAGLVENDVVLNTDAELVGKIIQPLTAFSAQVRLITSSIGGTGADIESNMLEGLLKGGNGAECSFQYLLANKPVRLGDRVITSGNGPALSQLPADRQGDSESARTI